MLDKHTELQAAQDLANMLVEGGLKLSSVGKLMYPFNRS
jgi:hypothetical protein